MTSLQVWHGTLVSGIEYFRPLSHFGTELQACRIIVVGAALDRNVGEPVLYECTLSYNVSELKRVDDIGSPNAQAIFLTYCRAIEQVDTFRKKLREVKERGGDPNDPEWLVWINELATRHGHRLLSYSNNVEGEGFSYCVLDASIISDIKSTSLTWEGIAKSYQAGNNVTHGFNERESEEINMFLANLPLKNEED